MKQHKRWLQPVPTPKADADAPVLDYDPAYVAEIMAYYHKHNTVPNLLPENYKAYLLACGLAETLPNCPDEYVVFSQAGGALARSMNTGYNRKGGRPRKTA